MSRTDTPSTSEPTSGARIAALESALAAANERVAALEAERDKLRAAYERQRLDLELLRRCIFVAKAERIDTAQLELEFAGKLAALDAIAEKLDDETSSDDRPSAPGRPARKKPLGRRDLREAHLPEERIVITNPILDALVARGEAEAIGYEESCKLGWKRGGLHRIVVARIKYRLPGNSPETTTIATAEKPAETFERSLAAPSLIARIAVDKYCDGLPLHRQEDRFSRQGVRIDRGTMCRWMEDAGATAGATVIAAMREEALRTAYCIATDATGVAVQPLPDHKKRQPCRRGHYFVQIADRDHVFFEYTPKETSAAVSAMLKGFKGYVQADAKSVYDALFRPPEKPPDDGSDSMLPTEVGCWSHCRRKFWEATVAKDAVAREGLARIGRLFGLERKWQGQPHVEVRTLRHEYARPHVEAFFEWAEIEYEKVEGQRGLLRSALGYAVRQREPLMRYLDDGRLEMTNNRSERELRRIAVGRHAWLFVGSDDHAESAGHLFSLIASARLHSLDPEVYLRDLFRLLAHWPRDRYLELSPRYFAATRARIDPAQLAAELGPLTIPALPPQTVEEK